MARLLRNANLPGESYYYITDYVVYPKLGSKDPIDTELIQFLVKMYFQYTEDAGIDTERDTFWSAYGRAKKKGGTWCDGIYGDRTREAVLAFEQAVKAPYKDGIVRPICNLNPVYVNISYARSTKLEIMNWNFNKARGAFDRMMDIKEHSIALYNRLYLGR